MCTIYINKTAKTAFYTAFYTAFFPILLQKTAKQHFLRFEPKKYFFISLKYIYRVDTIFFNVLLFSLFNIKKPP